MTDETEAVLDGVGARLQTLRRDAGITLADLAAATGISPSTLSRLENGRLRPTLEQLLPLARAHGVALDELVGAPPTGDPRVHMRPTRRGRVTYVPLSRRPGGIQAYKVIYPVQPHVAAPDLKVHDGYDWFYVLDGRIRLILGDRDMVLAPGEAAEFDCHVPHWIGNAADGPSEMLVLFGVQGERAHLAVRTTKD